MTVKGEAGELVVLRCWCGVQHAVPSSLNRARRTEHERGVTMSIWCPLGHQHVISGESEADKLRRQLTQEQRATEAAREATKRERERRMAEERSHSATKGAVTKLKKRVAVGVCPCCNRTFTESRMAKHIATKHPGFAKGAR